MNKIFMIAFMVVMTLAGMAAHTVGEMYTDGTVDGVFHKIIHGGLGAAAWGDFFAKDSSIAQPSLQMKDNEKEQLRQELNSEFVLQLLTPVELNGVLNRIN